MRMSFKMNGQIVPASPLLAVQVSFYLIAVFIYDWNCLFFVNSNVLNNGIHFSHSCFIPLLSDLPRSNDKLTLEDKWIAGIFEKINLKSNYNIKIKLNLTTNEKYRIQSSNYNIIRTFLV